MATKTGNDFVNELFRSRTAAGAQGQDVTDMADAYLDSLTTGLAGLRAIVGVLSPEGGDDETAPQEVEDALDAAIEAIAALRDEVDDLLVEHDMEPTSAVEVAAAEAAE